MPTCNICLENVVRSHVPQHRPNTCKCVYVVHEACYKKWLSQSNMAYNCIICHNTVPRQNIVKEINDYTFLKWSLGVLLFLFVIKYIKEIVTVASIILYAYISLTAHRERRNMFYYDAMNFLFGEPIPFYIHPHTALLRQLVRFWR
jgi:hypothetical protein